MTKQISEQNLKEEEKSFNQIKEYLQKKDSFIFDAGAGSGKTYTLIQSLKYILKNYGETLKNHNQKILCVTYTNVAAKEIKERLGNTNIVIVSTIHDFLWNEIKFYQKELIEIHKNKLEKEIVECKNFFEEDKDSVKYREIQDKRLFHDILSKNKEKYEMYYSKSAPDFKAQLNDIVKLFPNVIKNVTIFKKICSRIFKIERYTTTLENIKLKKKKNIDNKIDYTKVIYNSRRNSDILSNMEFSHDTLIEYSEELITKYEPLQKIICNKYPYILIDEYQDTMELVVKIMYTLSSFSKNKIIIGYYGDKKQNIYNNGVGEKIFDIHKNLKVVLKEYNRRSTSDIIDIGNSIRNDNLKQKTIYENCPKGSVSFYQGRNVESFIEYHKKEWNISIENPVNCLCLKNEDVAKMSGFQFFYEFFKNTPYYKKGDNYKFLREHILSKELEKLGNIQLLLFRFIDFKTKINNPKTLINEIIDKNTLKNLNINELRDIVKIFSYIKGNTLFETIDSIFRVINSCQNNKISNCIKIFIDIDKTTSIEELVNFIISKLFENVEEQKEFEEQKENVKNFLQHDFSLFQSWYNYITDNTNTEIRYHTFHGTKGLEFQNVLIILDSNFGIEKNFFSNLFKQINIPSQKDDNQIKAARNLLYVAITRAIFNLSILYTDDIDIEQEKQITNVFGEINKTKFND